MNAYSLWGTLGDAVDLAGRVHAQRPVLRTPGAIRFVQDFDWSEERGLGVPTDEVDALRSATPLMLPHPMPFQPGQLLASVGYGYLTQLHDVSPAIESSLLRVVSAQSPETIETADGAVMMWPTRYEDYRSLLYVLSERIFQEIDARLASGSTPLNTACLRSAGQLLDVTPFLDPTERTWRAVAIGQETQDLGLIIHELAVGTIDVGLEVDDLLTLVERSVALVRAPRRPALAPFRGSPSTTGRLSDETIVTALEDVLNDYSARLGSPGAPPEVSDVTPTTEDAMPRDAMITLDGP